MHSTISMGQVGLAFSRRQQCLFKINLKTLKYVLLTDIIITVLVLTY